MTIVAALQMASGPNVNANLFEAERLVAVAAASGAKLVVLPENFCLMGRLETDKLAIREVDGKGPLQEFLSRQAARHKVWLVGGTIPLCATHPDKVRASCLLFDDKGRRVARYDKLHLFDVQIVGSTESYQESATIEAGDRTVVAETPFGLVGMAVCYDLRFPELFRIMVDQGMEIMTIPSAFTAITGRAHWEPLLRARAIENFCYVVASAQGGYHASGRETHGDSLIVNPWGVVLDRLERGSGVVLGRCDHRRLESTRRLFPSLQHRRFRCRMN